MMNMQQLVGRLPKETEVYSEKPAPVPVFPLQIPHGLTRAGTLAATVGIQRLTALAMARPTSI